MVSTQPNYAPYQEADAMLRRAKETLLSAYTARWANDPAFALQSAVDTQAAICGAMACMSLLVREILAGDADSHYVSSSIARRLADTLHVGYGAVANLAHCLGIANAILDATSNAPSETPKTPQTKEK